MRHEAAGVPRFARYYYCARDVRDLGRQKSRNMARRKGIVGG
jgi:hypothetical protein